MIEVHFSSVSGGIDNKCSTKDDTKKQFTKLDLKNGMWVKLRNEKEFMVLKGVPNPVNKIIDVLISDYEWFPLGMYNEDLTYGGKNLCNLSKKALDIVDVLSTQYNGLQVAKKEKTSIWQREEKKIPTKEDLKKIEAIKVLYPEIKYLAKSLSDGVWGFRDKPKKNGIYWDTEHSFRMFDFQLSFLNFEDEPYSIYGEE